MIYSNKNLPNELIVQLDGQKPFDKMTMSEKLREIDYCIERCEMNAEDEKPRYYKSQIKKLEQLRQKLLSKKVLRGQ